MAHTLTSLNLLKFFIHLFISFNFQLSIFLAVVFKERLLHQIFDLLVSFFNWFSWAWWKCEHYDFVSKPIFRLKLFCWFRHQMLKCLCEILIKVKFLLIEIEESCTNLIFSSSPCSTCHLKKLRWLKVLILWSIEFHNVWEYDCSSWHVQPHGKGCSCEQYSDQSLLK